MGGRGEKRAVEGNTGKPPIDPVYSIVYCFQGILEQCWHKACSNSRPITDLTKELIQKRKLTRDTAWLTKNLRLDNPGTEAKANKNG